LIDIVVSTLAFLSTMPNISETELRNCLLNLSNPIAQRTHAAFVLRTRADQSAIDILSEALVNKADSALMRHEIAYILGQIGNKSVTALLESVLSDEDDDILVRHESAEALGAIGNSESLMMLKKYATHPAKEISETCEIAIDLINWRLLSADTTTPSSSSTFSTVDPAPPLSADGLSIDELRRQLMSSESSLFRRYRAMFTLRNMNTDEAAVALLDGFQDSSALFRHEIAYVLGQMQRASTIEGLAVVLQNENEHRMVRHEAAEALGAIGGGVVEALLRDYARDKEAVVRESCFVALDTIDYWNDNRFDEI